MEKPGTVMKSSIGSQKPIEDNIVNITDDFRKGNYSRHAYPQAIKGGRAANSAYFGTIMLRGFQKNEIAVWRPTSNPEALFFQGCYLARKVLSISITLEAEPHLDMTASKPRSPGSSWVIAKFDFRARIKALATNFPDKLINCDCLVFEIIDGSEKNTFSLK